MARNKLLSAKDVTNIFMNLPDDGNESDDPNFTGRWGKFW
jgi:hypothetical protein